MRHGKKINKIGRSSSHRRSMLSNMASSLIINKTIYTTLSKAKALKKYIEPIINKCKNDSIHSRRYVFKYLQNKYAVFELYSNISKRIINRPGGYTRIIKIGFRLGDGSKKSLIQLVDYNEIYSNKILKSKRKKTRRSKNISNKIQQ